MAGAGLIEIKRRIKSVTNTKKITKAMGLVATSKLRKARVELKKNNNYFEALSNISNEFFKSVDEMQNNIFITGNKSDKKLFILLSSDSGLCGGFNGSSVAYLNEKYGNQKSNICTVIIGQKGISYAKKYRFETIAEYVDIKEIPTIKEAQTVIDGIVNLYKNGEIGEVSIIYTKFNSPVHQDVVEEKLLPFEVDVTEKRLDCAIEPSESEVLENLIDTYIKAKLLNAMVHSRTSEQNARMVSMDGATKNANDLLNNLNIKYNRIRQSLITQEISEIVGGAEAQK